MKLYFKNRKGKTRVLGTYKTEKGALRRISRFCEEHDFTIPYMRTIDHPDSGYRWYDVGSHSESFYLYYSEEEHSKLSKMGYR